MNRIAQTFGVIFILTGLAFGAWYGGGLILALGLGAMSLVGLLAAAFLLGSYWTLHTLKQGAQITIDSYTADGRYDAEKTKALTELVRETLQIKTETGLVPGGFPATLNWLQLD